MSSRQFSPGWTTRLRPTRRSVLIGAGGLALGTFAYSRARRPKSGPAVFIAKGQRYDAALGDTVREGLLAVGVDPAHLAGRRVVLKPNLVEPTRSSPHLTTNPAVVVAVAEAFLRWGASVVVGEGPGHVRDSDMALEESGMLDAIRAHRLHFADLNYEDVDLVKNRGGASRADGFFLPRTVLEADLIVSIPKLKTHHWMGMTASLKNLYGVLPGVVYGWPKNVLHQLGIPQTVFDIQASLPTTLAVVDAIDCMEGDGPIMGDLKPMGLILVGNNTTAVDATCARIMGVEPVRVPYLRLADGRLGPTSDSLIDQRGEPWRPQVRPFQFVDYTVARGTPPA